MSNDLVHDADRAAQSRPGPKLSEAQKRAIIAQVAVTGDKAATAKMFGVHRNTVSSLCASVRDVANSPLSTQWRSPMLLNAVRATNDGLTYQGEQYDPYKAMQGGIAVLKGLGEFNADSQVNVSALVTAWPADLMTPQQVDGD